MWSNYAGLSARKVRMFRAFDAPQVELFRCPAASAASKLHLRGKKLRAAAERSFCSAAAAWQRFQSLDGNVTLDGRFNHWIAQS